jgi:peptidoglycan hydrolase-like protein with peptidoglycan-binding domain
MSNSCVGKKFRCLLYFGMLTICLTVGISLVLTTETHAENVDPVIIQQIQVYLSELGYPVENIDGVLGERTRIAIRNFQLHHNLLVDGKASVELLEFLKRVKFEQEVEFSKMSANQIYVNAIQFETQGRIEKASVYYKYLMKTYPDTDVGVKAAERFSNLSLLPSPQSTLQPELPQQPALQPVPQPTPQPVSQPTSQAPSASSLMEKFRGMDTTTKTVLGVGAGVVGFGVIAFALNDDDGNDGGNDGGIGDGNDDGSNGEDIRIKLGIWAINRDYLCNGLDITTMTWDIRSGNTFTCLDCTDYGVWDGNGNQITVSSYTGYRIQYTGTVTSSKDTINGTFVDIENETGCWNATYRYN